MITRRTAAAGLATSTFLALSVKGFEVAQLTFLSEKPNWHEGISYLARIASRVTNRPIALKEVAHSDKYTAYIQTSVASGNPPALFTWWNGNQLRDLVRAGVAEDLTEYWDRAQLRGDFSAAQRELVSIDGKPYGLLLNSASWVVLYNLRAFNRAGIAKPPSDWAELEMACDALKASGYTPFNSTASEGWTPFIWFSQLLVATDPGALVKLTTGEIDYTGAEVQKVFEIWLSLYAKGYFTDAREPDPYKNFANGSTGMFLIGDWAAANLSGKGMRARDDYRSFLMPAWKPNIEPAVIVEVSPIVVSRVAMTRYPELAGAIDALMGRELADQLSRAGGIYNGNLRATKPNEIVSQSMTMIAKSNSRIVARWWESGPSEIQGDLVALLGAFMINPTQATARKTMRDMQAVHHTFWSRARREM